MVKCQVGTEHLLLGLVREGEGVAARILVDLDADLQKIRNEVIRKLPASAPQPSGVALGSPRASQRIAPGWLDGLGPMLNGLADEIRRELGREPDPGDLLLVLTAAPDSVPAQALERVEVDVDELWGEVEHLRRQAHAAKRQLAEQIEQARLEKERAIESQQFQAAARHRDQERRLTEQQRARRLVRPRRYKPSATASGSQPHPTARPATDTQRSTVGHRRRVVSGSAADQCLGERRGHIVVGVHMARGRRFIGEDV